MKTISLAFLLALCPLIAVAQQAVPLTSLDLEKMTQGWGKPEVDRSIRQTPLTIAGKKFDRGIGTHASGQVYVDLSGGTSRFQAFVGVDDAARGGSVTFTVVADGKIIFESGVMKMGDAAKAVDLDLTGVKTLMLAVGDAGDGINNDHADWAEAKFIVTGAKPKTIDKPEEKLEVLTPTPGPAPRINGPRVYGARPGNPFIYRIPCTGQRPIAFSATNLPDSLKLDPATGVITGTNPAKGEYVVTLNAENSAGKSQRVFKIIAGDTLALTPPMGWNHWYTHYNRITDELMRQAADVMISSGMADAGYQYVNIDDCWMNAAGLSKYQTDPKRVGPVRDAKGNIQPNAYFPDMKGLTEYIHAKGLKAGIYTSPGPSTCAGFGGAYQHEAQDAKQFADWGFDFLKYDWCSYGRIAGKNPDLAAMKKPYKLMGDLLKQQKRDMVFNLCQYGMGNVWEWGADVGGHCWRTAGDLGFELTGFFRVALRNAKFREYSKPGSWNDPDYIQIGYIGAQRDGKFEHAKPCPLTPNEQYSFMSLWCLMASPLVYSGDMGRLDPFTLNVLCNPEVIDVDQDPLGQCARVIELSKDTFAMVKDLEDGSKAVGLFNKGEMTANVSLKLAEIGIEGKPMVRDLWRQKDLGPATDAISASLPRHGVLLVKVSKP